MCACVSSLRSQKGAGKMFYDFPSLEAVAKISLEDLQTDGLGFKAKVVYGTVRYLLENDLEAKISQTTPQEALDILTSIKGIGRWTAHVALCDWLANWSYYPFEDLAVRTWAGKLWHSVQWPQDERQFAALWQEINGDYTGVITFYLLSCAAAQQAPQRHIQEVLSCNSSYFIPSLPQNACRTRLRADRWSQPWCWPGASPGVLLALSLIDHQKDGQSIVVPSGSGTIE